MVSGRRNTHTPQTVLGTVCVPTVFLQHKQNQADMRVCVLHACSLPRRNTGTGTHLFTLLLELVACQVALAARALQVCVQVCHTGLQELAVGARSLERLEQALAWGACGMKGYS